jgi:hypothetical protein
LILDLFASLLLCQGTRLKIDKLVKADANPGLYLTHGQQRLISPATGALLYSKTHSHTESKDSSLH